MKLLQFLQSGFKQTMREYKNRQKMRLSKKNLEKSQQFAASKMTKKDVSDYCREMPKLIEKREKMYKHNLLPTFIL